MPVKYVFVTGGVVSGLAKASPQHPGRLLKARGYHVTMQKFDPTSTSTGTAESGPARRGICHRRRSGNGPGFRSL